MAGERKGDFFEVLTILAIQSLGFELEKDLHWEKQPIKVSVKPDLILGALENPKVWLLLTSTGSASNSHMKFWRNLAELFEVKRAFPKPPLVVSLSFEDKQMKGFKDATDSFFDVDIRLDQYPWGNILIAFSDNNLSNLPSASDLKIKFVRDLVKKSPVVATAISHYAKFLSKSFGAASSKRDQLWTLMRANRFNPLLRDPKETYFKRGLAKLMILDDQARSLILEGWARTKTFKNLPKCYFQLGYAKRSLAGGRIADPEIEWILENVATAEIERLAQKGFAENSALWDAWRDTFNGIGIEINHEYLILHFDELTDSTHMASELIACNTNGYRWLFLHIMEVLRFAGGTKTSYGYSELARDVGYDDGINNNYKILADWVNGKEVKGNISQIVKDCAVAFSKRLSDLGLRKVTEIGESIVVATKKSLLEQKVVTYEKLAPICWLIQDALTAAGIPFTLQSRYPTFVGEYMGTPHKKTSPMIIAKSTLIHWKSAYDSGKAHKAKELSSRGLAHLFQFNETRFVRRLGVKKLCLVVDGTFTKEQLDHLSNSGWDEILYPDEMDSLVKAIV
jgi:hypothetical protein